MKKLITATACALPLIFAPTAFAQTSGTTTTPPSSTAPATNGPATNAPAAPGATSPATTPPAAAPMAGDRAPAAEKKEQISGWSVKDKIIGETVYNENDDKIGKISDVVLSSDGQATYLIVGAGGFLGMGEHDVAIPFDKIQQANDKFHLDGYTKEQLKELPKVEVQK